MPIPASAQDWHIGLVGYGEVGRILCEDLRAQGLRVSAYDRKLGGALQRPLLEHARAHGVELLDSHARLAATADFVISAVTASQTLDVARACAPQVRKEAFYLDFNSASPGAKQAAGALIDAAGARYVEGAVMTSIPPYRIKVPLLLGGAMASATKMCRSVMVKGLEAMVIESFTAARHYGVEDAVIASLQETFPGIDWEKQGAYFFQRVIEHGRRRSEEMHESANTVREAGMPAFSAQGTAERQAWMADRADAGSFGERGAPGFARAADWRAEADRLLQSLKEPTA